MTGEVGHNVQTVVSRLSDGDGMVEVELTEDDRRNGWTLEALKAYHEERERARAEEILHRAPPRPRWANSLYNPMRWRG